MAPLNRRSLVTPEARASAEALHLRGPAPIGVASMRVLEATMAFVAIATAVLIGLGH